jgi:hypothetical protein
MLLRIDMDSGKSIAPTLLTLTIEAISNPPEADWFKIAAAVRFPA